MDDKEFNEIMQRYVDSTKPDKDIAFKKLNEKPQQTKQKRKAFKMQYVFIAMICCVAVALSIALPITLAKDNSNSGPSFCEDDDIIYVAEENIDSLKNKYSIDAKYPNVIPDSISFITSLNDNTLSGALLSYFIIDKKIIDISLSIISNTHVVQVYQEYFAFKDFTFWNGYNIRVLKEKRTATNMYSIKIYFTDGKYDYFLSAECDSDISPADILDILYQEQ